MWLGSGSSSGHHQRGGINSTMQLLWGTGRAKVMTIFVVVALLCQAVFIYHYSSGVLTPRCQGADCIEGLDHARQQRQPEPSNRIPSTKDQFSNEHRYHNPYKQNKTKEEKGGKKQLVMGLALGYQWRHVRNFVVSLRYSGYDGDLVLWVGNLEEETAERFHYWGVIPVPVSAEWPFFTKNSRPAQLIKTMGLPYFPTLNPLSYRHYIAHIFLQAYGERYSEVLFVDARDSIFQRDPFDWSHFKASELGEEGNDSPGKVLDRLYITLENPWFSIKSHGINADWVRDAYGEEGLKVIGDEKIACGGTVIGSTAQMQFYFERMVHSMEDLIKNTFNGDVQLYNQKVIDQAIHNYIIYTMGWNSKLRLLHNDKSPVMTIAAFSEFRLDEVAPDAKLIVLSDGRLANIVHQYDRHSHMVKAYNILFGTIDRLTLYNNPQQ